MRIGALERSKAWLILKARSHARIVSTSISYGAPCMCVCVCVIPKGNRIQLIILLFAIFHSLRILTKELR